MKAPDLLSMPLCRQCHRDIHDAVGHWRQLQRAALTETLVAAVMAGVIVYDGD